MHVRFSIMISMSLASLGADAAEPAAAVQPALGIGALSEVVLGLLAVLLFIGLLAWALRFLLRIQPGVAGQIRVLGGMSVGPRERVVLVQLGDTQLLLGVAPGRVQTLHVLAEPLPEPEATPGPNLDFASQLRRVLPKAGKNDA